MRLSFSPMLDEALRAIPRRYRLPTLPLSPSRMLGAGPAATLAIAIERARASLTGGEQPDSTVKQIFIEALADLIHKAMHTERGDPAFQAVVLRHRSKPVREYASLSAQADQDRRQIHAAVNAIAHPAKRQRMPPEWPREALARLHESACAASWTELTEIVQSLLLKSEIRREPSLAHDLTRLMNSPALGRLRRLVALASNTQVRQYRTLWDQHGPRSGSPAAIAGGLVSQQRGAAVEESVAHAFQILADRLNKNEGTQAQYRIVTSLRVPASIPADPERAKSEWDVVLLRETKTMDATPIWDICLLVEAKASLDAATTDFPRLLRGLSLLGHAQKDVVYTFESRQGPVRLSGQSLSALATDDLDLSRTVLYCSDAPDEANPRLLSAASRMQLLSDQASVAFASTLVEQHHADAQVLEPVWHQLLESPRWNAVLNQYSTLRQVRELMVHTDDLLAASAESG